MADHAPDAARPAPPPVAPEWGATRLGLRFIMLAMLVAVIALMAMSAGSVGALRSASTTVSADPLAMLLIVPALLAPLAALAGLIGTVLLLAAPAHTGIRRTVVACVIANTLAMIAAISGRVISLNAEPGLDRAETMWLALPDESAAGAIFGTIGGGVMIGAWLGMVLALWRLGHCVDHRIAEHFLGAPLAGFVIGITVLALGASLGPVAFASLLGAEYRITVLSSLFGLSALGALALIYYGVLVRRLHKAIGHYVPPMALAERS